jgi:hypothetical protein
MPSIWSPAIRDLLSIGTYAGIAIIGPEQFLRIIRRS